MPDFFNLINAKIERSNQNVREKERQTENLQSLFTQEERQTPQAQPAFRRIDLDSIMIGDEESRGKPSVPGNSPVSEPPLLSVEIGSDTEEKDYFKEINQFDYISLENLPIKAQNRALRTEYLEVRSKLKDFNEEMKQLTRKHRSLFIEVEKSKKETALMRNVIRSIANLLPDGSELKGRLDTSDWNITDVEASLLQNLQNVTSRVRNAEQYVTEQLKVMTEEVEKYKKVLNIMHNEKQAMQQERDTALQTASELEKSVVALEQQLKQLEEANRKMQSQAVPVISEEERLRQEKLRELQQKQRELELLQRQLEELNPLATPSSPPTIHLDPEPDTSTSRSQDITISIKPKSEPTLKAERQTDPVSEQKLQPEPVPEPQPLPVQEEFPALSRYDELLKEQQEEGPSAPVKPKLDKNPKRDEKTEVRHPFKKTKEKSVQSEEVETMPPVTSPSFDIDSFLQAKLQLASDPAATSTTPTETPDSSSSTPQQEVSSDEIIIPINIEDHIQSLNDKRLFVLKSIGAYGYSRNQELSDFIQEDEEGLEVFGGKGKNIKQDITNITRGLIDSTYLTATRITMGGRGGHNFNAFELTDIGKAIYKHLTKQQPVISEMAQLKRHHGSYEHGYLIKECSDRFREIGYTVYTDLESCRYNLPDGSGFKRFDFVIEMDGEKQLIEVERGTHNEEDFFKMCDKIYAITKEFYFITPNQSVLYDKTRKFFHLWVKKCMGGSSDPRIKGQVTVNFLSFETLTKTPLPKRLWTPTKF